MHWVSDFGGWSNRKPNALQNILSYVLTKGGSPCDLRDGHAELVAWVCGGELPWHYALWIHTFSWVKVKDLHQEKQSAGRVWCAQAFQMQREVKKRLSVCPMCLGVPAMQACDVWMCFPSQASLVHGYAEWKVCLLAKHSRLWS